MKQVFAVVFFAAITCECAVAQPYGRQYYPSSSIMSSGYRTEAPGNDGFIMAGIDGSLIHIDKTTTGGAMPSQTGPTSFQADYTLTSNGLSCMGMSSSTVTPQVGVCAIEAVSPNQTYQYVLAANFPEGVSVTYIDGNGAVVNTVAFNFPSAATGLVRPTIVHDDPSGEVYVCGAYNSDIYVIKIQSNGVLAWSSTYTVTGISQSSGGAYPKDMILSNSTGEVVLVGSVLPGAFYLKLDPVAGGINTFVTYGPNGDCHFSTIKNTVNNDFVVGGLYLNSANSPAGNAIMMRLTQAGGITWNTRLITGVTGQFSLSDIVGIEERVTPSSSLEYYGVTETNNTGCTVYGMSVYKLDATGTPVTTGNNEFHYTNATVNAVINLSINENNPPTNDVGFHIYADGSAASVGGHLLQESYFNGITDGSASCPEILTVCNYGQGPQPMSHQITQQSGLQQCNDITTTDAASGSITSICLNTSVTGGSNAKPGRLTIQGYKENSKNINIHPNPGNGIYAIELNFDAQLVVFDMLGKIVLETSLAAGSNSINLASYPSGIYNARISGNAKIETIRLVKE